MKKRQKQQRAVICVKMLQLRIPTCEKCAQTPFVYFNCHDVNMHSINDVTLSGRQTEFQADYTHARDNHTNKLLICVIMHLLTTSTSHYNI